MIRKLLHHVERKIRKYFRAKENNRKNKVFVEEIRELLKNRNSFAAVLGNGTSINELDLSRLENTDLFVSNFFYKHTDYKDLNVKLYFILDPLKPHRDLKFHENFIVEAFRNRHLEKCIIRYDVYDYLSQNSKILEEYPNVISFTPSVFTYEDLMQNQKYYKNHLPGVRHTPMTALLLAIQQGYSKIYIGGLDHDFVKKRLQGINTVDHFYQEEISEMIHLLRPLSEEFQRSAITFRDYEKIQELAKRNGRTIVNLSKDSCLDMFDKGDFLEY